jgi:hypothetical protein
MRNEIILPADPSIFSDRFIYWNRFIFIGCRSMEMRGLVIHRCPILDLGGSCFILSKEGRPPGLNVKHERPHLILYVQPFEFMTFQSLDGTHTPPRILYREIHILGAGVEIYLRINIEYISLLILSLPLKLFEGVCLSPS